MPQPTVQRVMAPPAFQLKGADETEAPMPGAVNGTSQTAVPADVSRPGQDHLKTGLESMGGLSPTQLRKRIPMQGKAFRRPSPVQRTAGKRGPVQMLSVQVMNGINSKSQQKYIRDLQIAGRPERAFSDSMGDHTTAFTVHAEGIRQALIGKSYMDGFKYMKHLYESMKKLPGAGMVAHLPAAKKNRLQGYLKKIESMLQMPLPKVGASFGKMEANGKTVSNYETKENRYNVQGGATDRGSFIIDRLQKVVYCYLEARELIPMSTLNVRHKSALGGRGKGEGRHIDVLRRIEAGMTKGLNKKDLYTAVVGLFDLSSVAAVMLEPEDAMLARMAPGTVKTETDDLTGETTLKRVDTGPALINKVWMQHLQSICAAFPSLQKFIAQSNLAQRFTRGGKAALINPAMIEYRHRYRDLQQTFVQLRKANISFRGELNKKRSRNTLIKCMKAGKEGTGNAMKAYLHVQDLLRRSDEHVANLKVLYTTLGRLGMQGKLAERITLAQKTSVAGYAKVKQGLHPWLNPNFNWATVQAEDFGAKEVSPVTFDIADFEMSASSGSGWQVAMGNSSDSEDFAEAKQSKAPTQEQKSRGVREAINTMGITIALANDGRISNLISDGRSQSPFTRTMGAHTIAWTLHIEHFKKMVVGRSVEAALNQVVKQGLPGMLQMEKDFDPGEGGNARQKGRKKELLTRINDYKRQIGAGKIPEPQLAYLQEFIGILLAYSNLIPGMTYTANNTDGRGEGQAKAKLEEWEPKALKLLKSVDLKAPRPWLELDAKIKAGGGKGFMSAFEYIHHAIVALRESKGQNAVVKHQLKIIQELYPAVYKFYTLGQTVVKLKQQQKQAQASQSSASPASSQTP